MKNIKQRHTISATVEEVYTALTNPLTIELWSGFPAEFVQEEGAEFSIWDGDITGKILKLAENQMVQQQWYFDTQEEMSVVTIRLTKEGNNTVAELVHENVPEEAYDDMVNGWKRYYFGAIKKYFS
ncbi:MAG: SRPBCC domain-containing protein [Bacteroidales bacterium]|nr:SRPBCC domain-containing protein [Bacteroidales bacterium]